jgi:hypothetical protein
MPISQALASQHIAQQGARLATTNRPYRTHWPERLFRHEPLQNIVPILRSGLLLSRLQAEQAENGIPLDIAPQEIIGQSDAAKTAVRLYFRPRNPTQWNIEGIREPQNFYLGKHAPLLYMMLFDAASVLTSGGVCFSDGNMQGCMPNVYNDDAGFSQLDFLNIYHDSFFEPHQRDEIIRARCSEVLTPSPLTLNDKLEAVLCRSPAERQTLLYELGANFQHTGRIRVANEAGIFFGDYTYVETVDVARDGVHVKFHSPRRGQAVGSVHVRAHSFNNPQNSRVWDVPVVDFAREWHFQTHLPDDHYVIMMHVRGCLAYKAMAAISDMPF